MIRAWGISAALHFVLLLAAGLSFCTTSTPRTAAVVKPDLDCTLVRTGPTLAGIERIGDSWTWGPNLEEAQFPKSGWGRDSEDEECEAGMEPKPGWCILIVGDNEFICHTALRRLRIEYEGRVVVIKRSEYQKLVHPYRTLEDLRESMLNSRSGGARLLSASGSR